MANEKSPIAITHVLEVDLYTTTSYQVVKAQQYDDQTRYLRVLLKDHEEDYDLPSGALVTFKGLRGKEENPQVSIFEIEGDIKTTSPAIIEFDITQAITRAGVAVGNIVVTYGNAKIQSIPIHIDVSPEAARGAASEEGEQDIIAQLTEELRSHETDMVKHLTQEEHTKLDNLRNMILYSSTEPTNQQSDDIWLQEYT